MGSKIKRELTKEEKKERRHTQAVKKIINEGRVDGLYHMQTQDSEDALKGALSDLSTAKIHKPGVISSIIKRRPT